MKDLTTHQASNITVAENINGKMGQSLVCEQRENRFFNSLGCHWRWQRGFMRLLFTGLMLLILALFPDGLDADEPKTEKYSPEVVAKAEKILDQAGLRRSAKQIQATGTTTITRAISSLTREKRELRLLHKDWDAAGFRLTAIRQNLQQLKKQHTDLSLQLTRVAGDTAANNRVVGLLNVTNSKMEQLVGDREKTKMLMASKRAVLSEAESKYAGKILSIRKELDRVEASLRDVLKDDSVAIAVRVMHVNFETPAMPSAAQILVSLNKRVERLEQEVFSETIPLEVENRSMYVNVVVGNKTTRMVVDSGASLICLPARVAAELGVVIPANAPEMELVVANGDTIAARGVILPRVRIGEFEVQGVDAAVLDVAADAAEPLLGMSFLDHFKFEINAADRSLKMLRVNAE